MTMPKRKDTKRVVQAWIELQADDPEAMSALAVARAHLGVGSRLRGLRRMRLVEIKGELPEAGEIEALLHRSTQFYNPHKERCAIRASAAGRAPLMEGECLVLVVEREGARREAAERWWRHETGESVEVREALAWAVRVDGATDADLEELTLVRGRRHGLLCNPHSQDCRLAGGEVPLPWLEEPPAPRGARAAGRTGPPGGSRRSGR